MTECACPICGSRGAFAFHSDFVPVHKCGSQGCGHLFVLCPMPGMGIEPHSVVGNEAEMYAERNARLVNYLSRTRVINPSARVLDFGAGSGHLAVEMERYLGPGGVVCVEADAGTVLELRRRNLEALQHLDEVRGPFDAVLAIEVLEHVVDPVAVLMRLAALLRRGGALFLTTPCSETRLGKRRKHAFQSPAHVHFFTERSLLLALQRAGYGHVDLRVIDAMYSRQTGVRSVTSWVKTFGRPLRARLFGPPHLTGIAYVN